MPGPWAVPVDLNFLIPQVMGIFAIVAVVLGLRWVTRSVVGDALAERIRARTHRRWGVAGEDPQRVAELEAEVSRLQAQVTELAERVDFAERLLAERRERKLGAGQ